MVKHSRALHPLGVEPLMRTGPSQSLIGPPSIETSGCAAPRNNPERSEASIALAPAEVVHDFAQVYDVWFDTVQRWVSAFGGPSADVDDLTQEVFVVVQRKLAHFDGRNLAGWLYVIAQRTVNDYRRRWWFRNIFLRERGVSLEGIEDEGDGTERLFQQRQDQERFYRLVRKMNARWRDSFVLFEVLGYSGEEIAMLQRLPAATVRTHLYRARKEFLSLVAKEKRS
jgi:RNA polymerase sigma-70 factor (ECF subfamily)